MNESSKKLDCYLETRLSKANKQYQVLVIKLSPNYEKIVFLEPAEIELVKLSK